MSESQDNGLRLGFARPQPMAQNSPLRRLVEGAAPLLSPVAPVSPQPEPPPAACRGFRRVSRPGRCANSAERGSGSVVHAVHSERDATDSWTKALCGIQPGGRVGWNDWAKAKATPELTCPRCLALVKRLQLDVDSTPTTEQVPAYLRDESAELCRDAGIHPHL